MFDKKFVKQVETFIQESLLAGRPVYRESVVRHFFPELAENPVACVALSGCIGGMKFLGHLQGVETVKRLGFVLAGSRKVKVKEPKDNSKKIEALTKQLAALQVTKQVVQQAFQQDFAQAVAQAAHLAVEQVSEQE